MKRLLAIAILIGVAAYIVVQFTKDRRFNPPSDYDYELSDKIDTDFYDPLVLKKYYGTALEIGTLARSLWRTEGIDVRSPNRNKPIEMQKATYYNQLIATANFLQNKLELSQEYKEQGYSKEQIKMLIEHGKTPEDLRLASKSYMLGLQRGSNGASVWELQKMLNQAGDSIPEDGLFNLLTTNRLREFQRQNGLYPSGEVDENTLKALLK